MSPFDYLKAINETKEDIMLTSQDEKKYAPFIVNRGLSFFMDTIFQANEVNVHFHLESRLQFDYLLNSVRKKNRYGKWIKNETLEKIDIIQQYYGYNIQKAKQVESIFSDEHIQHLRRLLSKGGLKE